MTGSGLPPIIQYWHSEDVPDEIAERMALVRDHNPDLRHMVFNEETAGAFIETCFSDREVAAFQSCAVPAMQADYFRYCAVYALGGVYCDADSGCSGSLASLLDGEGELFRKTHEGPASGAAASLNRAIAGVHVNNDLFGFSAPGHPLLKLAIDIATSGIESRFCESVPTVTGPVIFTLLIRMQRLGVDPFLEQMKGLHDRSSLVPFEREPWLLHLESIRSLVGDDSRITEACRGVRVSSRRRLDGIFTTGNSWLAYRQTQDHYPNWSGSIYR